MAEQRPLPIVSLIRVAIIGVAVMFAVFVVAIYFIAANDDDSGDTGGVQFRGLPTPVSSATPFPDTGPIDPNRPEPGAPAPDFALVDARDTTLVRHLSDFKGTPVVLNWFASWCGPCRNELPAFQAAQDSLGDAVQFFGINFQQSAEDALEILDDTGATFPAVLDADGSVSDHYRVGATGLPVTMFIDAEGVVQSIRYGEIKEHDLPGELAKIGITYQ